MRTYRLANLQQVIRPEGLVINRRVGHHALCGQIFREHTTEHPVKQHIDTYIMAEPEKQANGDLGETEEKTEDPILSVREKEILEARAKKVGAIRQACASHDVEALIRYATSEGGLLEDELRQIGCKSLRHA